ncbi:MAG: glycogen synthase GlgA [bacterium]|nr:glycogen synthase GlgA [bacterium]
MRICHVSSEIAPFAKTGGLADVAAGLSRYLGAAGHDVRLFLPLYRRIAEGTWELTPDETQGEIDIAFGQKTYRCGIMTTPLPGSEHVTVYLVDCPELFDREGLYTQDDDEHIRFALLSRIAIESCQRMQWSPHVFHCNDWHTGLLPLYLRTTYGWDKLFTETRTLLTIHNIGYQGTFPASALEDLGLMAQRRHLAQDDVNRGVVNFMKTGLMHADALSTVSRTYADEIQDSELGMGLEDVLRERRHVLKGIVNGVDYSEWDPATDTLIPHNFSAEDMAGKAENKRQLLEDFDLDTDMGPPLFGIISRLTGQKGFELVREVLPLLLKRHDVRLAVLGSGEKELERYFQWLRNAHPTKVAVYRGYSNELAHRIEASADMFLMPSRYEPCGLNQMYSLRYGTVPIVRRTGGLADTVEHFDPATGQGTGFVFDEFEPQALGQAMSQAMAVWKLPTAWARLMQNGMSQDYSWERQGPEYEALYESLATSRV